MRRPPRRRTETKGPRLEVRVEEFSKSEVLGEGGRLDQPGIGHGVVIVEGDRDLVQTVRR